MVAASLWATVDPHRSPPQRRAADKFGRVPARLGGAGVGRQQLGLRAAVLGVRLGWTAGAARTHGSYPEFAFPQQINPDLATPGWRPIFVDYLYLGFTNSTAFSPTDVMPLVPWAKSAMAVQATVSLVVIGLVVARAVNVLT